MKFDKNYFEANLIVGTQIKLGKNYADEHGFEDGEIIELVDGDFEYDNGLYTTNKTAPAIWNPDADEFDSIYHLFGNDFENWMDCEILTNNQPLDNGTID